MTGRGRRPRAAAAGVRVAAAAAAAAAATGCVRVDPGPGGVASARLADTPPSIVVGDVLRDAAGAPTVMRAQAFDESGREVPTAEVRFLYVPTRRDSLQRPVADTALVVDSVRGAVAARSPFVLSQGLVAVRVGARLQVLDTIQIVPAPASVRADTAVGLALRFDCVDTSRTASAPPLGAADSLRARLYGYNALGPFRVLVRGDSASATVPVRQRLVRWAVDSAPSLPPARVPGGTAADTVPVIGLVATDGDRITQLDTTDGSGLSAVRLRIQPYALTPGAVAADAFTVRLRALAQPGPTALAVTVGAAAGARVAGDTVFFYARLERRPGAACR